ncbi:hypothetical protein H4S02_013116, partial [Coemansia sp. RSA 2611]
MDEEEDGYSYACRCSGRYAIKESDLEEGRDIAPCSDCSLKIQVLFRVASDSADSDSDFALLLLAGSAFGAPDAATASKRDEDRVGGLPYRGGEQPLNESYSGHITVRTWTPKGEASLANSGSAKLFYWYFPAITPKVEAPPLVLWIQGGPGSSSMIGLFTEMGPLELTDAGEFYRRNVTWANEYDFLVVDQPAGTGFSSVTPKAKLSLDDLYPLASSLPEKVVAAWRAKYPKDV